MSRVCLCLPLLLFLFCLNNFVRSQTCLPDDSRERFASCSSCLVEAGEGCGWCLQEDRDNQNLAKGCVSSSKCTVSKFMNGTTREVPQKDANLGPSMHIKPQTIQLTLRPKIKHKLEFTAKRSENAVDIYFLLDLTGSMGLYKKQLETIPEKLVEDISRRTKDYQFGYGAFREKPMTPMSRLETGVEFNFEHFQMLTKDTNTLKAKIKKSQVSPNFDTPEAGLDGLMQVLLCKEDIGWRNHSTHIIVFITDAPSHIAGDGIIGGIWKPYEHKCSLVRDSKDPQKMIYKSLDNDYPSLSEINYWLEKTQKTVIFGTPNVVLPLYKQMVTEKVIYRAAAGDIGTNGEGLRGLVAEEYNKIEGRVQISAVHFQPSRLASRVGIKFDSRCAKKQITENEIICNGVNVDDKIEFTAEIELDPKVCEKTTPTISFEIHVFGQSHSAMKVEVNPVCKCEGCAVARNDAPCNQNGDTRAKKVCGACQCVDKQGETCQCSKEGGVELDALIEQCQTGSGKQECSGHGSCNCGVCKCFPGFIGKYCGCSKRNINCGDTEGRGDPQCEQEKTETTGKTTCKCREGWKGETCDCSTRTDWCKDPFTKEVCNGEGKCDCNKCACDYNEGSFCQKKRGVNEDRLTCDRLGPCILLDVYKNDPDVDDKYKTRWADECKEKERYSCFIVFNNTNNAINGTDDELINFEDETNTDTSGIDTICKEEKSGSIEDGGLKKCSIQVEFNTCFIDVHHDATEGLNDYDRLNFWRKNNLYVSFDGTKPQLICPSKVNMALLMGSAGGAGLFLFIVGFLSFCIVINLRDRREYKRFVAEQEEVWGQGNVKGNKLHKEKSSMRQSIRNRMSRVSFKT